MIFLKWLFNFWTPNFALALRTLAIGILEKLIVGCILVAAFQQKPEGAYWAIFFLACCIILVAINTKS